MKLTESATNSQEVQLETPASWLLEGISKGVPSFILSEAFAGFVGFMIVMALPLLLCVGAEAGNWVNMKVRRCLNSFRESSFQVFARRMTADEVKDQHQMIWSTALLPTTATSFILVYQSQENGLRFLSGAVVFVLYLICCWNIIVIRSRQADASKLNRSAQEQSRLAIQGIFGTLSIAVVGAFVAKEVFKGDDIANAFIAIIVGYLIIKLGRKCFNPIRVDSFPN